MVYQILCEAHLKEVALIQIQETMALQNFITFFDLL